MPTNSLKLRSYSRKSIFTPGIPIEFYAFLFVIPRKIPNNSMEFQRIPKPIMP
jgi:hypothetical protein